MSRYKFETSFICGKCLETPRPSLDGSNETRHWESLIRDPQKTLTVETDSLSSEMILAIVRRVEYKAERLTQRLSSY